MASGSHGVRFETARLASGPRLHYAEHGDPHGTPILLLHGWPDSWFSYSRVLSLLPRRHRAIVPDQRGFGDSERPAGNYAIDDLARDAADLLDALDVASAAVVGHSLGSFVARRVAEIDPDRVTRLVLIGSGFSPINPVTREVRASLDALGEPVPVDFARQFQASTVHAPIPPDFFEGLVAASVKLPARLWRAVFEGLLAFDDSGQLGRIAAPTLLLWGEHDAIFPREDQHRLAATIPDARLTIYPGAGHSPHWEIPARVASDLDTFVPQG